MQPVKLPQGQRQRIVRGALVACSISPMTFCWIGVAESLAAVCVRGCAGTPSYNGKPPDGEKKGSHLWIVICTVTVCAMALRRPVPATTCRQELGVATAIGRGGNARSVGDRAAAGVGPKPSLTATFSMRQRHFPRARLLPEVPNQEFFTGGILGCEFGVVNCIGSIGLDGHAYRRGICGA